MKSEFSLGTPSSNLIIKIHEIFSRLDNERYNEVLHVITQKQEPGTDEKKMVIKCVLPCVETMNKNNSLLDPLFSAVRALIRGTLTYGSNMGFDVMK